MDSIFWLLDLLNSWSRTKAIKLRMNVHLRKTMPSLENAILLILFPRKKICISWPFGRYLLRKGEMLGEFGILFCSRGRVGWQGKPSLCLPVLLVRFPHPLEHLPLWAKGSSAWQKESQKSPITGQHLGDKDLIKWEKTKLHLGALPHPRSSLLSLPSASDWLQSSVSLSTASKVGHSRKGKAAAARHQAGVQKVRHKTIQKKIIKHNVFVGGVWYIHFSVHWHFFRTINMECVSSFGVTSSLSALLSLSAVILYNLKSFVFWDSLLRQRKQILPIILQNSSNFPISKWPHWPRRVYDYSTPHPRWSLVPKAIFSREI